MKALFHLFWSAIFILRKKIPKKWFCVTERLKETLQALACSSVAQVLYAAVEFSGSFIHRF